MVITCIDGHRDRFGVEPICRVLTAHGCVIEARTYRANKARPASARAQRDTKLTVKIIRVHVAAGWSLRRPQGPRSAAP